MRLAFLVVALSSPAMAADQFDLICAGATQAAGELRHEPISRRYHVDLVAKQWCYNECTVKPLAEINATQIVFDETKDGYRNDPSRSLDYVDRTTGKWSFYTSFWQGDGTCQMAPFSGFHPPATKF